MVGKKKKKKAIGRLEHDIEQSFHGLLVCEKSGKLGMGEKNRL